MLFIILVGVVYQYGVDNMVCNALEHEMEASSSLRDRPLQEIHDEYLEKCS